MVHGKAMSSLKLGTLGARHPSQSPQLAAKESTMDADALKMRSKSALRASGITDAMPPRFWSELASICVSEAEALTYEREGHFSHYTSVFCAPKVAAHVIGSMYCGRPSAFMVRSRSRVTVTESDALSQL
jgi:hypothetical protein